MVGRDNDHDEKKVDEADGTITKVPINNIIGNRKRAVVVLGSAANPPHEGHLHCLRVGVKKAEELGYYVDVSTIAIAPLGYVRSKMERQQQQATSGDDTPNDNNNSMVILGDSTRLHLLRLLTTSGTAATTESLRFLCPDRSYGSALECANHLKPPNDDNVMIVLVVGGDRAKSKWRKTKRTNVTTVCCARTKEQLKELQNRFQMDKDDEAQTVDPNYYFATGIGPSTSSTQIRSILSDHRKDGHSLIESLVEKGYSREAASYLVECVRG